MILNPFAGPGGWEEGLRHLTTTQPLGIELDPWACATRHAAGHPTLQADAAAVDLTPWTDIAGLIASPPCQLFSAAGSGRGRRAIDLLRGTIGDLMEGNDTRPHCRQTIADMIEPDLPDPDGGQTAFTFDGVPDARRAEAERLAYQATLVTEPARYIHATRPRWVALEQVPAVLPLWEALAELLAVDGYSVWCGVVNAADYGVPQTRKRAVLLASLDREVGCPAATHAKGGAGGLLPWVSMADALGWDGITTGHETMRGAGMRERHGTRPIPDETEPSQTITGSADNGDYRFVLNTGRDWKEGGTRADAQTIPTDDPAPTLTGKSGGQWQWTLTRPATTVMGDPRVWPPGHKVNADDRRRLGTEEADARYGDRAGTDAITLEVWQALVLQSFPADYPVQGSRSAQFLQVGNAVPPLLARHLLAEVVDVEEVAAA